MNQIWRSFHLAFRYQNVRHLKNDFRQNFYFSGKKSLQIVSEIIFQISIVNNFDQLNKLWQKKNKNLCRLWKNSNAVRKKGGNPSKILENFVKFKILIPFRFAIE